jgi:hypothetical protein
MSKVVKAVTWGTAIIGLGYGLMKFTVPNEDEMRNVNENMLDVFFSFVSPNRGFIG